MTGDAPDILARLKAVLPTRWFADESPVLDGMLAGLAWGWAWVYSLLSYAIEQTRITTATGVWLDIVAQDFFAARFYRRTGEPDILFRNRISQEILREKGTRGAVTSMVKDLTGREPRVFEAARATDTGSYGSITGAGGGLAWGLAGGWGNLDLPFQCFVTVYRPSGSGIALVAGWADSLSPSGAGGYGVGTIEYASIDMLQGQVTDADIYKAVADMMPAASIAWTQITN